MSKFRRWSLTVVTMASVATLVLLVTGWGSAMASSVQSVIVANTASNPVPVTPTGTVPVHEQGTAKVAEQNLDTNGNIKVHEQGTANVNVTNNNLTVASTPVTGGAGNVGVSTFGDGTFTLPDMQSATALQIHMTSGVEALRLRSASGIAAAFFGPAEGGTGDIVLPLTRPITFDTFTCIGPTDGSEECTIDWVGNSP